MRKIFLIILVFALLAQSLSAAEIPLIDKKYQQEITKRIKRAFKLKDKKKIFIRETKKILENHIDQKIKVKFNNFE